VKAAEERMNVMKINTKSKLISSLLVLCLCVTMFAGATYAWFTDSVTSAGNIIKSGTLDVTMEWADGTKAVPAAGSTDWKDASAGAIFNYDKWEPGYTEVRHINIGNKGSLAFKYMLKLSAEGEVSKLAEVIDVYYADPAQTASDRALQGFTRIGTLAEVLANVAGTENTAAGNLKAGESVAVTIALKMQESAGNEYQGIEIGSDFAVQILAAQLEYEDDSFGDDYDKEAEFDTTAATAAELKAALEAGESVMLTDDIVLTEKLTVATGQDLAINLNGHDIDGVSTVQGTSALIENKGELVIAGNGTISVLAEHPDTDWNPEGFPTYASNTISNRGKLIIEDGVTIDNETQAGGASYAIDNYAGATLIVNGGTIKQSGPNGGDVAIRMNTASATAENNVTINGGTISGKRAIWIHLAGSSSATAPKVNLTINGGELTATAADSSGNTMAIYSYSYGNSYANTNVNINGGTFTGDVVFGVGYKGDIENVSITGGTFNNDVGRWVTADDFVSFKATTADSLADALGAGYAFVLADINLADAQITIPAGTSATMNLNGHDIDATQNGTTTYGTFNILAGATLNVMGDGNVTLKTNVTSGISAAIFQNDGTLNIYGGNYETNQATSVAGLQALIAVIDNCPYDSEAVANIYDGTFAVTGLGASNLIRNWPIHADGKATLNIHDGTFKANAERTTTYIWNHGTAASKGYMNFYGGTYDANVVYEDYYGQADIHIADGVNIQPYSGNN